MDIILGLSGLPGALNFLDMRLPRCSDTAKRLVQGLDAAAALVVDGELIAAIAEERLSRVKGCDGVPLKAIAECLRIGGLTMNDVTTLAHAFSYGGCEKLFAMLSPYHSEFYRHVCDPMITIQRLKKAYPSSNIESKFQSVPHHLAHAHGVYRLSGFSDSLIFVSDGMGEIHSVSVYVAEGDQLSQIGSITAPHSLGSFYSAATMYLGFRGNIDEFKVMGLAPYGNPLKFGSELLKLSVNVHEGRFAIPALARPTGDPEKDLCLENLISLFELNWGPRRLHHEPLTPHHAHFAAAAQYVLETVTLNVLTAYQQRTEKSRLCLSGGVALNCMLNRKILDSRLFSEVYVQAGAGDDGTAVGAAFSKTSEKYKSYGRSITTSSLGPSYTNDEVIQALYEHEVPFEVIEDESLLLDNLADQIMKGRVVGFFYGRMEFGPRALGNRSILAAPSPASVRTRVNDTIKNRESFRPLAPVVTLEAAAQLFHIDDAHVERYSCMVFTAQVRAEYQARLEAIVHCDGSARVQAVSERNNPRLWKLLNKMEQLNKLPVLLNTSFNIDGEPIVCTPSDAIKAFVRSNLDALFIENCMVSKAQQKCDRPPSISPQASRIA